MKLTKGKISKLYHKKRQSVKRYKRGNKNIQNKTFRKKRYVDLSRLTLKNFKGGLITLQNKRSEAKAKQDTIIASIPPQSRIPALATPVNDDDGDIESVEAEAININDDVDEKQDINKDNANPLTATPSAPPLPATPLATPLPSTPPVAPGGESNNKLEGAINVIIDEVVNRISAKMVSTGTLGGLQDPFISFPTAAHTEQDDAAKSKKKSDDEQMAKGADQIQNISDDPESAPVLADAKIVNKQGSMATAKLIPEGEGEGEGEGENKIDDKNASTPVVTSGEEKEEEKEGDKEKVNVDAKEEELKEGLGEETKKTEEELKEGLGEESKKTEEETKNPGEETKKPDDESK